MLYTCYIYITINIRDHRHTIICSFGIIPLYSSAMSLHKCSFVVRTLAPVCIRMSPSPAPKEPLAWGPLATGLQLTTCI